VDSLGTGFDALLTRGAQVALLAAGCWALLIVVAVAVEARTGRGARFAERAGCPPVVRAWLLGVLVVVLAGGPAHADTAPAREPNGGGSSGRAAGAAVLDGLPLPDRATGTDRRPTESHAHGVVVVGRGDSLWRIAHRILPVGASDAAVAEAVRTLYAANRAVIGADPDLVRPGERLTVPRRVATSFPAPTTTEEP
jgi:nucleoid-associated protein YgaU